MDQTHSTTNLTERKRGQHLGAEERGAIQALKKQGYSNHTIARTINWPTSSEVRKKGSCNMRRVKLPD